MNSHRSKGQRKKPKVLLPSAAMQSVQPACADVFAGPPPPTNGHATTAAVKDRVYEELFAEAPPARNGAAPKKPRPGPLSRKTNKPRPAADDPVAEPQPDVPFAPPAELFAPDVLLEFREVQCGGPSGFQDDSFASTELFAADASVAQLEVCVSPSAFASDDDAAPTTPFPAVTPSPTGVETPPSPIVEAPPTAEALPPPIIEVPLPPVAEAPPPPAAEEALAAGHELRPTAREFVRFLTVSRRPSIRSSTASPQSFLRCRDDPPTPFVSLAGKRKAGAEVEVGAEAEVKRGRAEPAGLFARITAPILRKLAPRDRVDEDEGIEAGAAEEVAGWEEAPAKVNGAAPAALPAKFCAVM